MEWVGDIVLTYMAIFVSHQCVPGPCSPTRDAPHPKYGGHAVHVDQPVHRADVRITNRATEGVIVLQHLWTLTEEYTVGDTGVAR